jgi:type I restriction enzyme S subunit
MKEGWVLENIGDLCQIVNGGTPKTNVSSYWDGDINWITPADLGKLTTKLVGSTKRKITQIGLEKSSAKLFPPNSIILSTRAPIGHLAINTAPMCTNQGCRGLVPKNRLDVWYLFYFLWNNVDLLDSLGSGTTFKELSTKALSNVLIPTPPLPEQQRIVSIIDKAFEAIDKAIENTQKNLQNAKELFESYLNNVFEDGGDNWDAKRLGDVLVKTETVDPAKKPNQEFTYLDVSSVNKDTKEIENVTVLLGKDAPSRARKLIRTNDVIFATVRPTHIRVAVITREYNEQVCSTGYFVLRAKEFLSNNFVFYFLLTSGFNEQMEKLQKGASYPAVTDAEVKSIVIPFPSLKAQQTIVQKLEELKAESKNLESLYQQKLRDLGELKKSILNKAFAGEL